MPRLMSFALTTPQLLDGSKTVTRRLGWRRIEAGDSVVAVRKAMGLRRGERVERLAFLEIVDVRRERLDAITAEDCADEGFPAMTPGEFVRFFCATHARCTPTTEITRIAFRRVDTKR